MAATLKVTDLREWIRHALTSQLIVACNPFGAEAALDEAFDGEPSKEQIEELMQFIFDELDERVPKRG